MSGLSIWWSSGPASHKLTVLLLVTSPPVPGCGRWVWRPVSPGWSSVIPPDDSLCSSGLYSGRGNQTGGCHTVTDGSLEFKNFPNNQLCRFAFDEDGNAVSTFVFTHTKHFGAAASHCLHQLSLFLNRYFSCHHDPGLTDLFIRLVFLICAIKCEAERGWAVSLTCCYNNQNKHFKDSNFTYVRIIVIKKNVSPW